VSGEPYMTARNDSAGARHGRGSDPSAVHHARMLDEPSPPVGAAARPLQLARPELPSLDEFAAALAPVWERAYVSNFGPVTRELERIAAAYTGLPHVLSVANADLGLTLAIAALRLPKGTKAIVPSFTFPSTLHAALWNGLEPVFADVDDRTWTATPDSIAPAVERAADPGLILATHCFLAPADAPGLERLAAGRGIPLVLDGAQAYATWIGDRHVGAFGDASVFSLGATKVVTSGEGGLAAFRDPEIAARFERLRSHGMTRDHEVVQPGLNAKLGEIHAALGCLTLPRVEEHADALRSLASAYAERLEPAVTMQAVPSGTRPTPSQFVVDLGPGRDAVELALHAEGIGTRRYFRPLHGMATYARLDRPELPVTERLGRSLLALPLHLRMTVADVDRVCDAVLAVL
jgi:dTDP-4-amino-4,6-dideoxygalactose transaminase